MFLDSSTMLVALLSAAMTAAIYTVVLLMLNWRPDERFFGNLVRGSIWSGPSITLVGAGPGDIGLLTVAGCEALRNADLILSDRLTSETGAGILELARCEVKIAQKYKVAGSAKRAQDELNQMGLAALKEGKRVVRLKCGDPFVFGRGGEEVVFFRQHGFEPVVIPGISSALYAPMAAGIPVTHRGVANEFLVATGMLKDGASQIPAYSSTRTTMLLMAVGRLPHMTNELIAAGYPAQCPIAIVERAGSPTQRVTHATVATVSQVASGRAIASPAVVVVGDAVNALEYSKY